MKQAIQEGFILDVLEHYTPVRSFYLEIAPGVYVAPDLSPGVRARVWGVLSEWWAALGTGSIVLVWRDTTAVGNLRIETLGEPPKQIVDADGILLVKRR